MIPQQIKDRMLAWTLEEFASEQLIPCIQSLNVANVGKFILAKDTIIALINEVEAETIRQMKGNLK